ncbi:MAG: hypothetical protein ACE15B_19470 [Bryobacteraceae bacterium]
MRLAILLAALNLTAATRIVDTIYGQDGTPRTGKLIVTCGQMVSQGKYVIKETATYKVVNGAVDITLFPHDSATPQNASCSVVYSFGAEPASRTWVVRTSATPLKISDVEQAAPASGSWPAPAGPTSFEASFTSALTVLVTGVQHGLGTRKLAVQCYDDATPRQVVEPDTITVHPTTFDVTVTFAVAQTGACVVMR